MGFPPVINVDRGPSALAQTFSGLSKGMDTLLTDYRQQKAKKKQLAGLAPLFEELGVDPKMTEQIVDSGLDPSLAVKALGTIQKARGQMQEEGQLRQLGQQSFNRMAEILQGGNLGRSAHITRHFGGDASEDIGEFESASGALESMLVDMVSRGTLSNARFKYITETLLPKATDTEGTIRGKMKALGPMLGLDVSGLEDKKSKSSNRDIKPKASPKISSEGTVRMKDPSTGKIYFVPRDRVAKLKSQGAELVE